MIRNVKLTNEKVFLYDVMVHQLVSNKIRVLLFSFNILYLCLLLNESFSYKFAYL